MDDAIDLKVLSQNSLNSEVPSMGSEFELSQRNIPRNNLQPPPIPERFDSLALPEDLQLKSAAWFQAGIPRYYQKIKFLNFLNVILIVR